MGRYFNRLLTRIQPGEGVVSTACLDISEVVYIDDLRASRHSGAGL